MTNNRRRTGLIVLALVALGVGEGVWYHMAHAHYETTDNAQIDGNLEPVRAGVTAYLAEIRFRDNQAVKKGDTLMVFNTVQLQARVQQAEAILEGARANLGVSDKRALASLDNAQASEQTALAGEQDVAAAKADVDKAAQDLTRVTGLVDIKAATKAQYDAAVNRVRVTEAVYHQALGKQNASQSSAQGLKTGVEADRGQVSATRAIVRQREAELTLAEDGLSRAYVIAPRDGIVARRSVAEGQYILEGQTLCALVDTRCVWITANFKETQLDQIKPGEAVEISVDAYPSLHLKGTVDSYLGATGARFSLLPPDNATGNFIKITQRVPVRINLSMPQNIPTVLYPGLSAFIKVKTE